VNLVLNNKHQEKEFSKYYLCGPEEMINLVSTVLNEHNVADKNIKFELFTTSSSAEKQIATSENGHTKITVLVDNEETTFEMNQKETILDASLKKGIDAPYSCQGGVCSSCLARVTKGSAEMKKNSILSDKEVQDGLILTCQAHPTSSEIVVDFDDV
jgi:ring-1,2-phenylacetyl-CoA epoxidase subunit PaaE